MKKVITAIIFILITYSVNADQNLLRIAIMDLQPQGVDEKHADIVSELLRSDFANNDNYILLERKEIKTILQEQQFQLTGCVDRSCAVKIGKLLSAQKVIVGTLSKLGDLYIIHVRLVDVEKGIIDISDKITCNSEADLPRKIKKISVNIIKKILEKEQKKTTQSLDGNYSYFIYRRFEINIGGGGSYNFPVGEYYKYAAIVPGFAINLDVYYKKIGLIFQLDLSPGNRIKKTFMIGKDTFYGGYKLVHTQINIGLGVPFILKKVGIIPYLAYCRRIYQSDDLNNQSFTMARHSLKIASFWDFYLNISKTSVMKIRLNTGISIPLSNRKDIFDKYPTFNLSLSYCMNFYLI